MKRIIYCIVLLALAACGGGDDRTDTIRSGQAAARPVMSGTMDVIAVSVLTPSPTATTPITFQIHATFTGTLNPGASGFDVPVVMLRVDATTSSTNASAQGVLPFTLTSGTPSSGTWTGVGVMTMPPQPAGDRPFSAALMPDAVFNFTGSSSSAVTGIVQIAP